MPRHGAYIANFAAIIVAAVVSFLVSAVMGDTGMHLLEKDGEERLVHFLNDTGHLSEIKN